MALEQLALSGQDPETGRWVFVPVIITTAELWICRCDPNQVTLNEGTLSEATFEQVPFIRFRKSLTTRLTNQAHPTDLAQANQDKQRTVVVINSTELVGFLSNWKWENREQSWPWREVY